jgi:hypothetical protein
MATVNSNIAFPTSPFIQENTGRPSREWIIWLQNPQLTSATIQYQVINGGVINNTTIGLSIPAAGKFTTLTAIDGIGGGKF